jgi:hypothetical protein
MLDSAQGSEVVLRVLLSSALSSNLRSSGRVHDRVTLSGRGAAFSN